MSDSEPEVGAITEIDGVKATEITKNVREDWVSELSDKLEDISAVTEVIVDIASENWQEVDLAVELSHEPLNQLDGIVITANLKSIGKQINNIVKNDTYASANIVENTVTPPELINNNRYKNPYYIVTVSYP